MTDLPMPATRWHGEETNQAWVKNFGISPPAMIIAVKHYGKGWNHNEIELYLLRSGQYAVVKHIGCSCYNAETGADIEVFPNRGMAVLDFVKYMQAHGDNNMLQVLEWLKRNPQ